MFHLLFPSDVTKTKKVNKNKSYSNRYMTYHNEPFSTAKIKFFPLPNNSLRTPL